MRLPQNPKCTVCGKPVNHISRCETDYHSTHHSWCCPRNHNHDPQPEEHP